LSASTSLVKTRPVPKARPVASVTRCGIKRWADHYHADRTGNVHAWFRFGDHAGNRPGDVVRFGILETFPAPDAGNHVGIDQGRHNGREVDTTPTVFPAHGVGVSEHGMLCGAIGCDALGRQ
jgi:hypothetical protein